EPDKRGAARRLEQAPDPPPAKQVAGLGDDERRARQPGEGQQREEQAEREQALEGGAAARELRQQADEEDDHLRVAEVAEQTLPPRRARGEPVRAQCTCRAASHRVDQRADTEVDEIRSADEAQRQKRRLRGAQQLAEAGGREERPGGLAARHADRGQDAAAPTAEQGVANRQGRVRPRRRDDHQGDAHEGQELTAHAISLRGALFGEDVAAEIHERLDGLGDESGRLRRVGERVRPGPDRIVHARRKHLSLDDARHPVVDGAEDRHRASVLLGVADEQLAAGCLGAHGAPVAVGAPAAELAGAGVTGAVVAGAAGPNSPAITFVAACATVSRSAKPSSRIAMSPGALYTSTPGSGSRPPFGSSPVRMPATLLSSTLTSRNPAPAVTAPACASATEIASTSDRGL